MYVDYGLLPNPQGAGIMRFDPGEAQPAPVPVVSGLSGINGLAIDDRAGSTTLRTSTGRSW
jgi:hypothetical protein